MIDVDPKVYLGEEFVIRWKCPNCKQRSYVRLDRMETEECPACAEGLSVSDRKSLREFRDMMAEPAGTNRRKSDSAA